MNISITDTISIVTLVSVVIWNIIQNAKVTKQIALQNIQLRADFFSEYTKRYQDIVVQLPTAIFDNSFDQSKYTEKELENIDRILKVYFDLCAEELFLYKQKMIDEVIWFEWKDGIIANMKQKYILTQWKNKRCFQVFYKDFSSFLNQEEAAKILEQEVS